MTLLAPGQSCIHVHSSSMYLNTCNYPIEICISAFHLRHLCIPTILVKATHNIKHHSWNNAIHDMHETGPTGAWVPHDADNCCLTVLTAFCYCYFAVVCMLYTTCFVPGHYMFHYCIMQLLNQVPLKLNKSNSSSNTLKSFKS
jgi:hypothetical protein